MSGHRFAPPSFCPEVVEAAAQPRVRATLAAPAGTFDAGCEKWLCVALAAAPPTPPRLTAITTACLAVRPGAGHRPAKHDCILQARLRAAETE